MLTIKEWAEEDRPREKLLLKGAVALSNAELLAILIGSGNAEESAVQVAQHIHKQFLNLAFCNGFVGENLGKDFYSRTIVHCDNAGIVFGRDDFANALTSRNTHQL